MSTVKSNRNRTHAPVCGFVCIKRPFGVVQFHFQTSFVQEINHANRMSLSQVASIGLSDLNQHRADDKRLFRFNIFLVQTDWRYWLQNNLITIINVQQERRRLPYFIIASS